MHFTNFCATCGERLNEKRWRVWLRGPACRQCSARGGNARRIRSIVVLVLIVIAAFGLGQSLRPAPPPLTILRAANSPLSDLPVDLSEIEKRGGLITNRSSGSAVPGPDDIVYLCGARTQKGTPCKRRVHVAGERCYQHKGKQAIVPLEKLTIKP